MTATTPSPASQARWHPRDREAHLLAGLLRMSRLTLLYGQQGSGKTTLLQSGVLPLLRRRTVDRSLERPKQTRVVIPFPDRRAGGRSLDAGAEVAIFFDAWHEAPLAPLHARIAQVLGGTGATVSTPGLSLTDTVVWGAKSLDVRFLFIFDRFEEYLAASQQQSGVREFADEFIRAVNQPFLAANFLVSLRDDAEPAMVRFRGRISGFEDACLRLPSLHRPAPPPLKLRPDTDFIDMRPRQIQTGAAPDDDGWVKERRKIDMGALAPMEMPRALDWPAASQRVSSVPAARTAADPGQFSVDALAAEIAALAEQEPWNDQRGNDVPDVARDETAAPTLMLPSDSSPLWGTPSRRKPGGSRPILFAIAGCAVIASFAVLMWFAAEAPTTGAGNVVTNPAPTRPTRAAGTTPSAALERLAAYATTTAPIATPPPIAIPVLAPARPKLQIMADAGNSTDSAITRDITRLVAPSASVSLDVLLSASWAGGLAGLHDQPRIAIARYDALQAVRKNPGAGKSMDDLRIVMPLFIEEIYFIARADSPLTYIHEIKGRKINIGPPQGSRALTAATVYERMFGAPMPVSQATYLEEKDALRRLLTDKSVDVVVLAGAPPLPLLAAMTPEAAHSIKMLELAHDEPQSRRALQAYLPASVAATTFGEKVPTLAVMSFLVTSDTTDPGDRERIGKFARSLCTNLPVLRREGNRKWREVDPDLQLPVGWPYSAPAAEAFRWCRLQDAVEKATAAKAAVHNLQYQVVTNNRGTEK